jgi:hypothetical protein
MMKIIIGLLFVLLPLAQSTSFDLPGRAGTGESSTCCDPADPNLIAFAVSNDKSSICLSQYYHLIVLYFRLLLSSLSAIPHLQGPNWVAL